MPGEEGLFSHAGASIWKYTQTHWRPVLFGATFATIVWIYLFRVWYYDDLQNYYNLGNEIGSYEILKGDKIPIAYRELRVGFNDVIFYEHEGDTNFVYPSVYFFSNSEYPWDRSISNMKEGQVFSIKTTDYYYNIVLDDIFTADNDTFIKITVFRNELPMGNKK